MPKKTFRAVLQRPPGVGTWTILRLPFDATKTYDSRGQIRVKGKINDVALRTTLRPRGDGTHYLVVNRDLRDRIGAEAGDRVQVTIDIDKTPRRVSLPRDFAAALTRSPAAKTHFRALSPSHQKAYVEYIREAKRPETRRRRVDASLDRLEEEAGRGRKPG